MTEISRTVAPDVGAPVARTRLSAPLRVRLLLVIILTLVPPIAIATVAGTHWFAASSLRPVATWAFNATIAAGSFPVRLYYIFLACVALVSLAVGFWAGDVFFVAPARALRRWLIGARETNFSPAPVIPRLPRDEFGDIGREIAVMAARVSQTTEHDKVLMGEKSLFLTIAAHQLRTPLTALSWSIEELLDPKSAADAREKLLMDLKGGLHRLQLVVNHMLASANIEEGKFGYVMEQVDIVPVVEKLATEFTPVANDRGVEIVFEHGDTPPVYADAERISLALFDLITNAIDYTPKGGRITIALAPRESGVEVSVADTGVGIPARDIPHLFTKFYRGDTARHLQPNGSGLGLYLVKNIVTSHGSAIHVQSDGSVGGARFSFILGTRKP